MLLLLWKSNDYCWDGLGDKFRCHLAVGNDVCSLIYLWILMTRKLGNSLTCFFRETVIYFCWEGLSWDSIWEELGVSKSFHFSLFFNSGNFGGGVRSMHEFDETSSIYVSEFVLLLEQRWWFCKICEKERAGK